jgi:hypothetical protein
LFHEGGVVDEGQWVEGRLTGQGKRTYPDGRTLEGEFREGKQWNAVGVLRHMDGTVDEGLWVEGKLTGHCKKTYPDGRTLEGEFTQGRIRNGKGLLKHTSGTVEEGTWELGKLTGHCKRVYADGRTLEGEFKEGKLLSAKAQATKVATRAAERASAKHLFKKRDTQLPTDVGTSGRGSKGTAVVAEGAVTVSGASQDRNISVADSQNTAKSKDRTQTSDAKQRVVRVRDNGTVEEGQWVKGKLTGRGRRTYPDGRTLEGEFRGSEPWDAQGVLPYADGTVVVGQWSAGVLSGNCSVTYPDGRTLEGEFREGRVYNGKGVLQYASGKVEEGQWVEGRLSGFCRRIHPDGRVEEGHFSTLAQQQKQTAC